MKFALAFFALLLIAVPVRAAAPERWVVDYAAQTPLSALSGYDVLVFDSQAHPPLGAFREQGKQVLGYLSLGEISKDRPWFARVQAMGLLRGENPVWKGSFHVDLRDPRWAALVIQTLIPQMLHDGFTGLFLDTLDDAEAQQQADPKANAGMVQAAVRLVQAIRLNYPSLPIMMNRGYALLPAVAGDLTMVLGESVLNTYDFKTKRYQPVAPDDARFQIQALKAAQAAHPALKVMTLDYCDPKDAARIRALYAQERAQGFIPYVATIDLDKVIPEPAP